MSEIEDSVNETKPSPYAVVLDQIRDAVKAILDTQPAIRSVAIVIDWAVPAGVTEASPPSGAWIVQPQKISPVDIIEVSAKIAEFQAGFCLRGATMFRQASPTQPIGNETDGQEQTDASVGEPDQI